MTIEKINGLIAAPFTPMNNNGKINPMIIPNYSEFLKKTGVKGVFICGTTGEGLSLSIKERFIIAKEWIKQKSPEFKVIIHVGTTSLEQSKSLANHAQEIGADAISTMAPMFLKPNNINNLVKFCKEIAKEANDTPFYYYNIPSISGVELSMVDYINLASKEIPSFYGMKFTHNNFMEMQSCINLNNNKWNILHGLDEVLLAGLSFGINGAVGSTYNFLGNLYNSIIQEFKNGKIENARKKQLISVRIIETMIKYGGSIVAGKSMMKLIGIDCGPTRSPLPKLSENEFSKLSEELKKVDFYKYL
ncbi:MAG: dihydrodipicolinate synthase family protein [Flavobacteriaceae bacterium]|tara:strand:+ start:194 stop:1105 length:912 start_codon:yes stop_codon:yes gene_type:complete